MADTVELKLTGLDGVLDTLKQLPPEVVSKRGGVVRAALRKGAMVLVKQARANFRAAVAEVGKSGITDTTGFTERQIVVRRRPPPGGVNGEYMLVTVRSVKHPSGNLFRKRPIKTNDIAFIMEAGSAKQPATPWMRPTFAQKAQEAVRTTEDELVKRVDMLAQRLLKQGGA